MRGFSRGNKKERGGDKGIVQEVMGEFRNYERRRGGEI